MFSTRRFTRSSIDAFGRWIYEHSWFRDVGDDAIADTMTESFTSDLTTAIELYQATNFGQTTEILFLS